MDEEGSEIRELDRPGDRLRILTELRKHPHPLTHQSDSLYNIVNGQVVSETKVNVQDAVEIEQDTRTSFASSLSGGFHHPIKKTLETMQVLKRGVKIKGKTVYDLETVFVPSSLIDQYGCIRKRRNSVSELGTTGNALTFGKRHSLKYQWKRKVARPASAHSSGHRLT